MAGGDYGFKWRGTTDRERGIKDLVSATKDPMR